MMKLVLAAVAGLIVAQPAVAGQVLGDYNVYATGPAHISGGSYGDIASGSFTNANGTGGGNFISQTASTAALDAKAHSLSAEYAAMAATGALTSGQWTPNDATLTGTSSGLNVFNIDGSRYGSLYALSFAGPGTGAIVNISGASFSNFVNINFGNLQADQVLFNFFDANSVYMGGFNFKGSILAPNARVQLQGGSVTGSVIGNSFYSEGTNIGGAAFSGLTVDDQVAGAVPEPATWAMMILGFGLIGGAMRRRRGQIAGVAAAA